MRDHFCAKLDHTELGITAKIADLEALLRKKDPELAGLLKELRVSPSFYGFRWLTLLMTQELPQASNARAAPSDHGAPRAP